MASENNLKNFEPALQQGFKMLISDLDTDGATNGQVPAFNGTTVEWATVAGGGGMVIGDAVSGANDYSILYVDSSGNLAQDTGFVRNTTAGSTFITNNFDAGGGTTYNSILASINGNTIIRGALNNSNSDYSGIAISTGDLKTTVSANLTGKTTKLEVGLSSVTLGNTDGGNGTKILINDTNQVVTITNVPTYADDAAAATGGLTTGMLYKTTTAGITALNIVP